MTVSAPPRPPRPSDPVDRAELEALVEALIEEARRRAQRRRRRNAAVVTLVALVGVALFAVLGRSAQSQTASPAVSARSTAPAQAAPSRIAFFTGVLKPSRSGGFVQTELYVVNADGSAMRKLVRHASGLGPDPDWGPAWSPDGLMLAFGKRLGPAIGQCGVCHTEIFVMNADGSGQRNLTREWGFEVFPVWSPDWRMIAFASGQNPDLFVMNADGSGQRRVSQDAIPVMGRVSWSPDGRRLAFVSGVQGNPGNLNIYVVNVDGSGQQQLTNNPGPNQNPAWSPDGKTIAFQRIRMSSVPRDFTTELYLMNADGSGQRKLARMSNSDGLFSWSPDGRRIAFVSKRDGNDEVYFVNVDGSGLRNLTRNPARDGHPKWSSDGTKVGFVSNRGGNRDIYVMNADGSRQRNLTRDLDQQAFGIVWSPAQKK
jgi:Tol biopolymer transport system component